MEKAYFAAGCFWGVEAAFRQAPGVAATASGYSGGTSVNPSYPEVCTGKTGHAETVEVEFDPARISYDALLEIFWANHDPTTLNRQGPDVGHQYRSAIFFTDAAQQAAATVSRDRLAAGGTLQRPIVTEIVPFARFYRAEEYHQQYLEKRGQAFCHVPTR